MINSRITDILNIKYPIIQGGMAWISDADLAVGVSEAGGLGIISGVGETEDVRAQIKKAKSLTNKPFGKVRSRCYYCRRDGSRRSYRTIDNYELSATSCRCS